MKNLGIGFGIMLLVFALSFINPFISMVLFFPAMIFISIFFPITFFPNKPEEESEEEISEDVKAAQEVMNKPSNLAFRFILLIIISLAAYIFLNS